MNDFITSFVGLDVHRDSIAMGIAPIGREPARFVGTVVPQWAALCKALSRLGRRQELQIVYEAGPCGYTLARQLRSHGHACEVIAPASGGRSDDGGCIVGISLPWWMWLRRSTVLRGWVNYYGRFQRSALHTVFDPLNRYLERWLRRKYKRLKYKASRAGEMLRQIRRRQPALFAHWALAAHGGNRSRMNRETHAGSARAWGATPLGYSPMGD